VTEEQRGDAMQIGEIATEGNLFGALGLAAALALGCGGDERGPIDASPPARRIAVTGVGFDARGISEPIAIEVPAGTRSLTVVARGHAEALYALAHLETGGVEHVELPDLPALGQVMRDQYLVEEVGAMPGALHQSIRLGLFTHVHPNRPDQALPAGEAEIRIATSDPAAGPVDVELLLPEEDGGRTLPVNVFAVSNEFRYDAGSLPFLTSLAEILGAADITVEVEMVVNLPDTGLSSMTELSEPQEPPTSMSSELARLAGAMIEGDALNVFVVDELPFGVAGWSLGTPGPPLPDTYYSAVVAANHASGDELGRVLGHEIAHYIGLSHVVNRGLSGKGYPDQLDDTEPGTGNLMEGGGTLLTADQAFVLGRYPLLRP
jgi:hypothetical protein